MSRFEELLNAKFSQLDEVAPVAPVTTPVAGQAPAAPVAGQAQPQAQPQANPQQALATALASIPWKQAPAATTMLNNAIKQLPGQAHEYLQNLVYDTNTKSFIQKPAGQQPNAPAATTGTVGTTGTTTTAPAAR